VRILLQGENELSAHSDIAHARSRAGTGWGFAVMLLGMLKGHS